MAGGYEFALAPGRDPGLMSAIRKAGGVRQLARLCDIRMQSVQKWPRVPRHRLMTVSRLTGIEAEILRPDLKDWIEGERGRQWMERARSRFAISRTDAAGAADQVRSPRDRRPGPVEPGLLEVVDLGLVIAAVRFVADRRGLTVAAVLGAPIGGAGKRPTVEQAARSRAAALAVVVGRAPATTVAALFGMTRQNVENAAARFLRARDGDDADDIAGGWVEERGRLRQAKAASDDLWVEQRAFVAQLAGASA